MEISSFRTLADLGMDDSFFFNQWPMSSFEEFNSTPSGFGDDLYQSYVQEPVMDLKRAAESSLAELTRPAKQQKTANWNSCKMQNLSNSVPQNTFQVLNSGFSAPVGAPSAVKPEQDTWSNSSTITFPSSDSVASGQTSLANQNFVIKPCQGAKRVTNTRLAQSQDHIMAERKRREKLSQRFITLSTLIPGLKKMDKASVLTDAIKYMKQLQEKVKILEDETKKETMESVVFVKKYECYDSPSHDSFSSGPVVTEALPQIEARFCSKDVLISIHCEKKKGMLERTVAEIEKLRLSVVNSSVMSFGNSSLNITIIAKKDEDFAINIKDVVKRLRNALKQFM